LVAIKLDVNELFVSQCTTRVDSRCIESNVIAPLIKRHYYLARIHPRCVECMQYASPKSLDLGIHSMHRMDARAIVGDLLEKRTIKIDSRYNEATLEGESRGPVCFSLVGGSGYPSKNSKTVRMGPNRREYFVFRGEGEEIRNNPNQYVLPGGNMEVAETTQTAAVREFLEEMGTLIKPAWLQDQSLWSHTFPAGYGIFPRSLTNCSICRTEFCLSQNGVHIGKSSKICV
jgi:hypothetical protein